MYGKSLSRRALGINPVERKEGNVTGVRGQLDYCVVTVRSDPTRPTKPGWFFATVLIQEKGPCLHILCDNLPQWLTNHRWEREEGTMLGEAATSQGG